MQSDDFPVFERRFRDYAGQFRNADGAFDFPIRRKIEHTFDVCRTTEEICRGERMSPAETRLFRLCALFHDLSRFEQYRTFRTFRDADSFDHGDRSEELMLSGGFLQGVSPADQTVIACAVRLHNKMSIPPDTPAECLPAVRMVRDADKLDILKLVYDFFTNPAKSDPTMRLDLPVSPGCTDSILQTVLEGKQVRYTDMRNVNDFLLTLFSWAARLNYAESARLALERRLYPNLYSILSIPKEKTARLPALTEQRLRQKAEKTS